MSNVFISYARQDEPVAAQLRQMLKASGEKVYSDDQTLVAGEEFSRQVERTLAGANVVVVLLSRNSSRGTFVEEELRLALQRGHVVVPVLLDDEATKNWIWPLVSDRQAVRVKSPTDLTQVVRAIQNATERKEPPGPAAALPSPTAAAPPRTSSIQRTLLIVIVAAVSAILGGLVTWLVK